MDNKLDIGILLLDMPIFLTLLGKLNIYLVDTYELRIWGDVCSSNGKYSDSSLW